MLKHPDKYSNKDFMWHFIFKARQANSSIAQWDMSCYLDSLFAYYIRYIRE